MCELRERSNAHFGFDDFDGSCRFSSRERLGSDIRPGFPFLHARRVAARRYLPGLHLLYDGPMRGVGFRPRIAVQPQPILCGSDGVGETKRSALSPGRINIARACWDRTGYVLLARGLMGLSRQLPILQLRPMHGHRERYCFLLRDQSPVLAPAARRLSGSILRRSFPRQ